MKAAEEAQKELARRGISERCGEDRTGSYRQQKGILDDGGATCYATRCYAARKHCREALWLEVWSTRWLGSSSSRAEGNPRARRRWWEEQRWREAQPCLQEAQPCWQEAQRCRERGAAVSGAGAAMSGAGGAAPVVLAHRMSYEASIDSSTPVVQAHRLSSAGMSAASSDPYAAAANAASGGKAASRASMQAAAATPGTPLDFLPEGLPPGSSSAAAAIHAGDPYAAAAAAAGGGKRASLKAATSAGNVLRGAEDAERMEKLLQAAQRAVAAERAEAVAAEEGKVTRATSLVARLSAGQLYTGRRSQRDELPSLEVKAIQAQKEAAAMHERAQLAMQRASNAEIALAQIGATLEEERGVDRAGGREAAAAGAGLQVGV